MIPLDWKFDLNHLFEFTLKYGNPLDIPDNNMLIILVIRLINAL